MPTKRLDPPLEQISFTGVRDSVDPTTADPRKAQVLQNCYPQDPQLFGGIVGRPGFDALPATPSQLGAGNDRRGQRSFQFTELDGTEHTMVFVGGKMYEYSWSGDSFTDRSANQPTTDKTAIIYCVTFKDEMLVTDGVNTPWSWDGSGSGGGAFTTWSNMPVIFGPIVVYYAKAFGIKNTERNVIVWGEENQINVGFEQSGPPAYNNSWQLGQTDQEALTCLYATNEALYYWRERSIGRIEGRVTPEFKADGTRDGVSETIGTRSPAAVIGDDEHIHFFDAENRLYRIDGRRLDPLWEDMRETVAVLPRAGTTKAFAVNYSVPDLLLFGVQGSSGAELDTLLVINRNDSSDLTAEEYVGTWVGFEFTAIDLVKDDAGEPFLFHLSDDGYVYQHGNPGGTKWDDNLVAGTQPITHVVRGSPLGYSVALEKYFDRVHVTHRAPSSMTDISLNVITPNGRLGTVPTYTIAGGLSLWGSAVWGTDRWSVAGGERRAVIGVDAMSRWAQVEIVHSQAGEQFGLLGWRLDAYPMTEEVDAA